VKPSGGTAERLLIIDDDEKLSGLLKDYLESFGYAVDLIHNGTDGLHKATAGNYDAIILDVMLPGMNGLEVLRGLRKETPTPVLMLTALGDEPDRIAGLDIGADDYLPKTSSTNELLARLRAILRRSSLTVRQHRELLDEKRERDQAHEIQLSLLPKEIPSFEGYEISGAWQPARTVSGDYYDVFRLDENKLAVCIADVAGKGMPAALLMANLQAAVRVLAPETASPAGLCRKLNEMLYGNIPKSRYITFFYGVFDRSRKTFAYTRAGHNPPCLLRHDGTEMRLEKGGTVLGLFRESLYEDATIEFGPGDKLVFFTDGVTEVEGPKLEQFGDERLLRILRNHRDLKAEDLKKTILSEVSDFCGGDFSDDLTLLVITG
jgi:phosphoserine phosphatase RsbU/P